MRERELRKKREEERGRKEGETGTERRGEKWKT